MKTFTLLALTACALAANAHASEEGEHLVLTGKVIATTGCAESDVALQAKNGKETCLGFNGGLDREDLVVGQRYTLGGYLTEDGFFPNEIL